MNWTWRRGEKHKYPLLQISAAYLAPELGFSSTPINILFTSFPFWYNKIQFSYLLKKWLMEFCLTKSNKKMKTIFITGASTGLGKATAKLFASKGWNVIATMRRPENEKELNALSNITLLPLDVTNAEQI